ncbi:MAG: hypothetical protein M3N47_09105, partial [Chloroflexota bacterium]|nr:hypothetical protein [Chloroflexota bacterium]
MSALLVGYARVWTHDQDLTAQRDALAALGVSAERTYVDHGQGPRSPFIPQGRGDDHPRRRMG